MFKCRALLIYMNTSFNIGKLVIDVFLNQQKHIASIVIHLVKIDDFSVKLITK